MITVFDKLKNSTAVTRLLSKDGRFVVEDNLSLSLLVASAFNRNPQRICVVTPNLYTAQDVYEKLVTLIGEDNTLFFPQDEVMRIDVESYSKEMLTQRIYVLEQCLAKRNCVLVCHTASLTRYLPSIELFNASIVRLEVGKQYNIKEIIKKLTIQNFIKVNKIDGSLQYALRGDILDIYPVNYENPIRIEFFDDEIESIRYFSLTDQLSIASAKNIEIYPGTDIIVGEGFNEKLRTNINKLIEQYKDKISYDVLLDLKKRIQNDLDNIEINGLSENYYKYYSFVLDKKINILDYFQPNLSIVYDSKKCIDAYNFLIGQAYEYYKELFKLGHALPSYDLFDDYLDALNHTKNIVNTYSEFASSDDISLRIRAVTEISSNVIKSIDMIDKYIGDGKKVIVCLSEEHYKTYLEYLNDYEHSYEEIKPNEIPVGPLGITIFKLGEGFELIDESLIYLSAKEIFGYKPRLSKFLNRYKSAKILKSYEELEKGDYVVHDECGIGQFQEITTLEVQGVHKDFLKIKYAGTGVLYVPLEQFKLVRKYVSKEGAVPKINTIGGTEWEKTKLKIKERVNDLADRLLKLYAERNSTPGFAFKEDDEFQYAFERAFPYVLTDDQNKAVEEIKKDMEQPHPMDRLLCGDVGFGKTEVAFRAAFKAILSGAQVALLCPTTLLARQHYERAIERFSIFGVKIALFSRFVPDLTQKQQIEEIKKGNIHFIIGTHRLLSKEIVIPNLKLLIIDEEQRFGVEHKEKIKEMSKNIDCLTLTATPIPRTLQMSLLGIRSLSQLQSAPLNRMPIQTYVAPFEETLVKETIERELARNGQVFYLHNVTSTIYTTAKKIAALVKGAKVDVVHGKMDKDAIEDVMAKFYAGEIDILVCTSIIETGLDIANANTIIIEDADKFGLSQLYQIKGRVGRSNKIAYAYLLYNDNKELSEIAKKRLKALKDFTELGSGFKIAQRDLSIRGAGDILGPEQAGFIDSVGIDMYIKLLNEVIQEKQNANNKENTKEVTVSNISIDGYIPSNYINETDKLEVYQEIQKINKLPELEIYKNKLIDIYGKLPQEVELLLRKHKIDILAANPYISEMKEEMGSAIIIMSKEASSINKIGVILFEKMGKMASHVQASFVNRQIKLRLMKNMNFLDELEKLLTIIGELSL